MSPLSEEAKHAATALPASTQHTALSILADILKDAPGDVQTQANLIGDYVRDSARYSLHAGGMPESETDFAIWFLQNGNLGYCVHFASAATVLLRAAGIPARYVSGYIAYTIPGVPVPVTDRQAHAWVEYYHPTYGWTVLEVTPGAEDIPDIPTAPTESTTEPTETTRPAQTVGTTAPTETTAPPAQSRPQAVAPTEPPAPSLDQQSWFRWLMGCLLTVAFLLLQYGLRQNLRRRWLEAQTPKQKLLRRWKYARFLARLTRQAPPESLHFLAEKAAFSQHAPTAEECRQFDLWLQQTRQTLLQKPWPLRLLLRLLFAL